MSIDDMNWFPGKLKKHSDLECQRIVNSIISDGFLFPIGIGKVGDKNYIIDGECTYNALQQLKYEGYEIPEIPVYFVKCNEDSIKKIMLISTSSNHCVSEVSLKEFVKGTDINLKDFAFNDGTLIDFYDSMDMNLWKETLGGKEVSKGIELKPEQFEGLLK